MTNAIDTTAIAAAAAAATAAPKVKLTREEKLREQYNKAVAAIEANTKIAQEAATELNNIAALAAVDAGSAVLLTIGKGETTQVVPGTVVAVKVEDDGSKQYKVQYGQGFDADFAVVKANKIALPVATEE